MNRVIREGSVLVRSGTTLPNGLDRKMFNFVDGWCVLEGLDEDALNKSIKSADWHLLFLISPISGIALHPRMDEAIYHAVSRTLAKIEGRYNSAEVGHVTIFNLGLVFFVSVTLYPRQVQESGIMESKHYPLPETYPEA